MSLNIYRNDTLGFSAMIPSEWTLHYECVMKSMPSRWTIIWSIPAVWSELENQSIENVISFSVYSRNSVDSLGFSVFGDLLSLEDVVKWELMRVKDSIKSSREITSLVPGSKSIITNEEFDGNMYLIKRTFFFKNGLGYVVGFTATAGTYEKNLSNYDLLLPSISFQTPSRISIEINLEKTSNSIDFIYNIFTPKHDEINENIAYVSVGWNLWQELRNNADVNQLESVDILYPSLNGDAGKHKNEYTGRLFLKPRAINEFFIILCREKKVGDRIRIESLPKDKIEKFWEIINFEASEPILQVEFNNKSYVLNLIDCNGKTGIYIEKIDKQDI